MQGAFFALHDDRAVSAFAWDAIARALDLRVCETDGAGDNATPW